ncbi:MAG: hypothetical protein MZW92_53260 [Comamonadaceae bacterium]|nr:hypothetical protein [Comamonadaceae bacterium]
MVAGYLIAFLAASLAHMAGFLSAGGSELRWWVICFYSGSPDAQLVLLAALTPWIVLRLRHAGSTWDLVPEPAAMAVAPWQAVLGTLAALTACLFALLSASLPVLSMIRLFGATTYREIAWSLADALLLLLVLAVLVLGLRSNSRSRAASWAFSYRRPWRRRAGLAQRLLVDGPRLVGHAPAAVAFVPGTVVARLSQLEPPIPEDWPMTDAARIGAKVNQVRARLLFLLLANFVAVAVCGVALVAVLAGFRDEPAGGPVVLAAVAFGLTAVLLAILRTPSGPATAERIDRRLGLQQRLETAWECLASRDELDLLLLRDAAQRVHYVQTSIVAPLRLSRATKISVLAGVMLVLGVSIFRILDRSNRWGVFPSESSARAGQESSPAGVAEKTAARAVEAPKPGRAWIATGQAHWTALLSSRDARARSPGQRRTSRCSSRPRNRHPPQPPARGASADRPGDASRRADASRQAVNPQPDAGAPDGRAAGGSELP